MTQFTPHQDDALERRRRLAEGQAGHRQRRRRCSACSAMPAPARPRSPRHIADGVDGEVKFAAFTGKAASVMRGKGCGGATTIH